MKQNKQYSLIEAVIQMTDSKNSAFCKITKLHDLKDDIYYMNELMFQVESDNFFANLATMIDLTLQDKEGFGKQNFRRIYKRVRDDLMYLHHHYNIVPK